MFSSHRLVDKGRLNRKTAAATKIETDAAIAFGSDTLVAAGHTNMLFHSGDMRVHPVKGTEFLLDYGTKHSSGRRTIEPLVAMIYFYRWLDTDAA